MNSVRNDAMNVTLSSDYRITALGVSRPAFLDGPVELGQPRAFHPMITINRILDIPSFLFRLRLSDGHGNAGGNVGLPVNPERVVGRPRLGKDAHQLRRNKHRIPLLGPGLVGGEGGKAEGETDGEREHDGQQLGHGGDLLWANYTTPQPENDAAGGYLSDDLRGLGRRAPGRAFVALRGSEGAA